MRNFIFNYNALNKQQRFYISTSDNYTNLELNELEVIALLKDALNTDISELELEPNITRIKFQDKFSIEIENGFFDYTNKLYADYFQKLIQKITDYAQREEEILPENQVKPKINRDKSSKMAELIIEVASLGLAGYIIVSSLLPIGRDYLKQIQDKISKGTSIGVASDPTPSLEPFEGVTIDIPSPSPDIIADLPSTPSPIFSTPEPTQSLEPTGIPSSTPDNITDLPSTQSPIFSTPEPTTQVNSQPITSVELEFNTAQDGKLSETKNNCQKYLDPMIARYGLPYDLTYALVAQEYGKIDFNTNRSACGPMQIEIWAHNGEYFHVPVYQDGVKTDTYDDFYAILKSEANNPFYKDKKVLFIDDVSGHFQIGCALLRRCINAYENIFIAYDAYNKGLYALSNCLTPEEIDYYKRNINDFSWLQVIPNSERYGPTYGDSEYLWHILKYLQLDDEGCAKISYNSPTGEPVSITLTNLSYGRQNTLK